ncbi:ubiquitin carboxyl-terminal hydrolase 30 homolog [Xenia sp. Carnegie-2017]|uniref:ubiquitin carboxyl-terminal hydrolase 30 homolog n=1 Tax=Xenia sp. Carnegie-2017 TaxID=2897299 RepID=UPI001F03BE1C|nr:ubiquitin carboxyl-terminal hydrolase 30 homolog [Xenia sp. Carnegie-2017]
MEEKVLAAIGICSFIGVLTYVLSGRKKLTSIGPDSLVYPGLVNVGNSCYLNSVLQALASVSIFVSWLKQHAQENNDGKNNLTKELFKYLQILNEPSCRMGVSFDPSTIFECLYSHGWVIPSQQHDAHEIFLVLLSTVAEELAVSQEIHHRKIISSPEKETKFDNNGIVLQGGIAGSKLPTTLSYPFDGLFANQMTCEICSYKHAVKFDAFQTISLSLPSMGFRTEVCTLEMLLEDFMNSESLDSVKCPQCFCASLQSGKHQKTHFLKKLSIAKLPSCLSLLINRSYWRDDGAPYKNNMFVKFSETLKIDSFVKSKQPWNASSARVVYRLMSVIVHTGDANCGHYVTYRRTSGYKWSVSSDERVRSVSLDHVLHTSAYMIFYEKKT